MKCTCESNRWIPCEFCIKESGDILGFNRALAEDFRALEPRSGDRMQPQDANPDNQEGIAGRGQCSDNAGTKRIV